ncbi:Glycosyl transferase family 2 [Paracoccus isoporae]|uniref:Glycosyl transferase family 2 n=1 Tax=Paracoccus isoporae TaxID=591205 RepID=A0A1G7BAG7_9RHOB|nr:glycosyltransferase family 2 protein [Paracoccus isoporae]SDE24079.1 Glycosyl transferase family 2 [Paracoccus isoporae]
MSEPFSLSVVIPNRNRADLLLRAVLSVQDQTADAIEIIVVDDFSRTDLSAEYAMLEEMGVRILRQPRHQRGPAARNRGAREARGSHVSFLDSDDIWLSGRYDEIRSFYADPKNGERVLVSHAAIHIDGELRDIAQPVWHAGASLVEYVYRDAGRVQTSMLTMPVSLAHRFPFDETLRVNQDTDLAMRMDRAGIGFEIATVPTLVKDETPDPGRLTMGRETADLSYDWFRRESHDWSRAAKSGYHLQDRVWRLADSGRRGAAYASLARSLFPPVSARESARRGVGMVLGQGGYETLRGAVRKLRGDPALARDGGEMLARWNRLDRRAREICAALQDAAGGEDAAPDP